MIVKSTLAAAAALALTACASNMGGSNMNSSAVNTPSMGSPTTGTPAMAFSQAGLPDAVKVPAGNRVAMETVGVGQITYECKVKANMPGQFE